MPADMHASSIVFAKELYKLHRPSWNTVFLEDIIHVVEIL